MISKFTLLFLSLTICTTALGAKPGVGISRKGDTIEVTVGGKPFAVYNANSKGKLPKPFFYPVRGPGGTVLTRKILQEAGSEKLNLGHKHHKGIWVAVDEVNHVRFWAEKGLITTSKIVAVEDARDGSAAFGVVNEWKGEDGKTIVYESTTIRIYPNRVLAYDIVFTPAGKPVTFRDTKEGIFGFRMVKSMRENESGKVENSAGLKGTKACWGKTANWIDYYGPIDGKTFGVAIFDHPKNFRKSRYHVRHYGLFSISPFGEKAYTGGKNPAQPVTIQPGKSLRLRYAMYIHAGDTKAAKVADVYKSYVKSAK